MRCTARCGIPGAIRLGVAFFVLVFWLAAPQGAVAQDVRPLSLEDVEELLQGVSEARVLAIAEEDCIDFRITDAARLRLLRAGGSEAFVSSLRTLCFVSAPPVTTTEDDPIPGREGPRFPDTGLFGALSALLMIPTDTESSPSGPPIGIEAQAGWGLPRIGIRGGIGFWGALKAEETAPGRSDVSVDLWRFVASADVVFAPSNILYGFAGASTFSDGTVMARAGAVGQWETSGGIPLSLEIRLTPRFVPYWEDQAETTASPMWSVGLGIGGRSFR